MTYLRKNSKISIIKIESIKINIVLKILLKVFNTIRLNI
mgnify:CR=1 FL=1